MLAVPPHRTCAGDFPLKRAVKVESTATDYLDIRQTRPVEHVFQLLCRRPRLDRHIPCIAKNEAVLRHAHEIKHGFGVGQWDTPEDGTKRFARFPEYSASRVQVQKGAS